MQHAEDVIKKSPYKKIPNYIKSNEIDEKYKLRHPSLPVDYTWNSAIKSGKLSDKQNTNHSDEDRRYSKYL